jgi:hypothetical protein
MPAAGVSSDMRFLRGLAGKVLPCGCLIGVYETYEGGVIATIDARGAACSDPQHHLHALLSTDSGEPVAAEASRETNLPPRP